MIVFGVPECDAEGKKKEKRMTGTKSDNCTLIVKLHLIQSILKSVLDWANLILKKLDQSMLIYRQLKINLFTNMYKAKTMTKYEKLGVSNDLTKTERKEKNVCGKKPKSFKKRRQASEDPRTSFSTKNSAGQVNKVDKMTSGINSDANMLDFNHSSTKSVNSYKILPQLNCFYTNADQLQNKLKELEIRTQDTKPHIIGITEVKPKNGRCGTEESEYSLGENRKYQMFSKNIDTEIGRGLLLYIDKELDASEFHPETKFEENLMVKINLNNADKLLVCLNIDSITTRPKNIKKSSGI